MGAAFVHPDIRVGLVLDQLLSIPVKVTIRPVDLDFHLEVLILVAAADVVDGPDAVGGLVVGDGAPKLGAGLARVPQTLKVAILLVVFVVFVVLVVLVTEHHTVLVLLGRLIVLQQLIAHDGISH